MHGDHPATRPALLMSQCGCRLWNHNLQASGSLLDGLDLAAVGGTPWRHTRCCPCCPCRQSATAAVSTLDRACAVVGASSAGDRRCTLSGTGPSLSHARVRNHTLDRVAARAARQRGTISPPTVSPLPCGTGQVGNQPPVDQADTECAREAAGVAFATVVVRAVCAAIDHIAECGILLDACYILAQTSLARGCHAPSPSGGCSRSTTARPAAADSSQDRHDRTASPLPDRVGFGASRKAATASERRQSWGDEHVLTAEITYMLTEVCGVTNVDVVEHLTLKLVATARTRPLTAVLSAKPALVLRRVFADVLFDAMARDLQVSGDNLRVLFKAFDTHSFGNLDRGQVSLLLVYLCRDRSPSPQVLDFIFESIAQKGAAVIEYGNLFNAIFRTGVETATHRTIRSVAVISRHGARLPLKSFPQTLRWPTSATFWEAYGGKLTPVGVDQHLRLGAQLRKKYILTEGLFDEQSPETTSRIVAFTSNMDRTLMSAQSCLLGFCPGASVAFVVDEDGVNEFKQRELSRDSIRICMSMSDYTPLLHGFKQNPAYTKLKAAVFESGKFSEWADSAAHVSVVEKLWTMTAFEKISPALPMHERLANLQSVAQQIGIEKAHQMELLMNPNGLQLDLQDQEVVLDVARYICRLRYCGHSAEDQAALSRLASGLLPAAIVNNFRAIAEETEHEGHFTMYSAHDNTIMALLAHLGFRDFPLPHFAAHLVFELHEIDFAHYVKILYNPDPECYTFESELIEGDGLQSCDYLDLPRFGAVEWNSRQTLSGHGIPLGEFVDLIMNTRGSFSTPEEWNSAAHVSDGDTPTSHETVDDTPMAFSETYDVDRRSHVGLPRGTSPSSSISLMGQRFREHITRSSALTKPKGSNLPLKPFKGQVAGHPMTFMELGANMLCKPVRATCSNELVFYQHLFNPQDASRDTAISPLLPFLPTYHGEIFVNATLETVTRFEPNGEPTNVRTRTYSLKVPQQYSLVEFDTADLDSCASSAIAERRPSIGVAASDSSSTADAHTAGQVCIVLENLLAPFTRPCVLDVKLGTRQHGDDATDNKRERAIERCATTTSASLGLRVSGMRVWHEDCTEPQTWDKAYGKQLTAETFNEVFAAFFNTAHHGVRVEVMQTMQRKIEALNKVLQGVDGFRFFSSSLLLIYDGASGNSAVDVRLIDFARVRIPDADGMHSVDVSAGPDQGALLGLTTLAERLAVVCANAAMH